MKLPLTVAVVRIAARTRALLDPYNQYMTMERDFFDFGPLAGVVTDTHFAERDRMGRLVAFVARPIADGWSRAPIGIGVDEATALVIDATGAGTVLGAGAVYVLRPTTSPASCTPGEPLQFDGLELLELVAGDSVGLPSGQSATTPTALSAGGGVTTPQDPY